jgi:hypothetical protein
MDWLGVAEGAAVAALGGMMASGAGAGDDRDDMGGGLAKSLTDDSTPLGEAGPFEYVTGDVSGDVEEVAARGVSLSGNEPGGFRLNPNGLDVDYFDGDGNLCAQYHETHGAAHGHNFDGGVRDNSHLPMSPIGCR